MNTYTEAAEAIKKMRPKEAIYYLLGVIAGLTKPIPVIELPELPDVTGEEEGGDK